MVGPSLTQFYIIIDLESIQPLARGIFHAKPTKSGKVPKIVMNVKSVKPHISDVN